MKKRPLMPFFVFVMLEHGHHGSVQWQDDGSFIIRSRQFSQSLGTITTWLRRHLDWLERNHYVTDLKVSHGFIQGRLVPPPVRSVA